MTAIEKRPHPATFSDNVLVAIGQLALRHPVITPDVAPFIIDPFAGTGKLITWAEEEGLARLRPDEDAKGGWTVIGVDLEPEWAAWHPNVIAGDARNIHVDHPEWVGAVDAIITSPAYGNRMADQYAGEPCPICDGRGWVKIDDTPDDVDGVASGCANCDATGKRATKRYTYRLALGREMTAGNGAAMQWGDEYRRLHLDVIATWPHLTREGALVIVNMSDHIRGARQVPVTAWWIQSLIAVGYDLVEVVSVDTPRQGHGANGDARCDFEHLLVMRHGSRIDPGRLL